jgi:SepF-like predicted cell division protein (DUF552 family)
MGLIDKIGLKKSSGDTNSKDDSYMDLGDAEVDTEQSNATQIYFVDVQTQEDAMNIKDALYEGDIVVMDMSHLEESATQKEHVVEQIQKVVQEVNGDIVSNGNNKVYVTPNGVSISRQKL